MDRPELIKFHDYRVYLKEAMAHLIANKEQKSLRSISRDSGISPAYLAMILGGQRNLSEDALHKLAPIFKWSQEEVDHLRNLCLIADSEIHEVRKQALARIQSRAGYSAENQQEIESYRYISHWYFPAIKQLALLPGFRANPKWIQEHLRERVGLPEIRDALKFLFEKGYLKRISKDEVEVKEKGVECHGGVYRIALAQFHREILELASKSIEKVPRDERSLMAEMFPISIKSFPRLRDELNKLVKKIIRDEAKVDQSEVIYNVSVLSFPISKKVNKIK